MSEVAEFYEKNAAAFDGDRGRQLMERAYLDEVLARLDPERRHILDLGCGPGEPIARYPIDAGRRVTGIDASAPTIALAAERFPQMAWSVADMRTLAMRERSGAIIAWDSSFTMCRRSAPHVLPIFASTSRRAASAASPRTGTRRSHRRDATGSDSTTSTKMPRQYPESIAATGSSSCATRSRIRTAEVTRFGWRKRPDAVRPPRVASSRTSSVRRTLCSSRRRTDDGAERPAGRRR